MLNKIKQTIVFYCLLNINKYVKTRKPDTIIGEDYLKRWEIIPENRFMNIYYHEIRASDLDRHLHDHPYWFSSFILEGGYLEHTKRGVHKRGVGDINLHTPWRLHRLEMIDSKGANTIFITGPKIRKWGFKTENGWMEKDKYLEKYGIQGEGFVKPLEFPETNNNKEAVNE
jgi:hypothetical protein